MIDRSSAALTRAERQKIGNALVRRVVEGRLLPSEAEELAVQDGLGALYCTKDEDRWIFDRNYWPIQFAIFWIAWRDVEKTAHEFRSYHFWRGHIWKNPLREGQMMLLPKAQQDLWQQLAPPGNLICTALVPSGSYTHPQPIRQNLDPSFWLDARFADDSKRNTLIVGGQQVQEAQVARDQVLKIWSAPNSVQHFDEGRPPLNRAPNKGGRPTVYDWDAMWIEVCRIVHDEGLPLQPSELRNRMQNWFAKNYKKSPGESEMKEKFRALYEVMRPSV